MELHKLLRSAAGVAVAASLMAVVDPAAAAAVPRISGRDDPLSGLVHLAAQRIQLSDKVAAAKFGTDLPIDDPVREEQVLDQAAALASAAGLDVASTEHFFQVQIDASKVVQHGLFTRWSRHPDQAPTTRPDLIKEVRPLLDEITREFIDELAATSGLRHDHLRCEVLLVEAVRPTATADHLDRLHRGALRIAIEPSCPGS